MARIGNIAAAISLSCVAALMWLLQAPFAVAGTNVFTPVPLNLASIGKVQHHPARPGVVFAISASALYRSTDAGASWQMVSEDFFNGVRQVAIDPSNPDRVLIAGSDGFATSSDGGATVDAPPEWVTNLTTVTFNSDGSAAYRAIGPAIWRSTDAGQTWQLRSQVTPNPSWIYVLQAHPTDPQILYAGGGTDGFFVSPDGAATWLHMSLPLGASLQDLAVSASNPQLLWAGGSYGVYKSEDGGVSWTAAIYGPGGVVAIDPADDDVVYAFADGQGMQRTTDGGLTWAVIGPYGSNAIRSISVDATQPGRVLAGGSLGMYVSNDAGASWSPSNTGLRSVSVSGLAFASGQTYLQVMLNGVLVRDYVSGNVTPANNDGLRQLQSPPWEVSINTLLAQPGLTPQSDRLLVSLGIPLVRSNDAGASWTPLASPCIPGAGVVALADSPADPQTIVAACYDGYQQGRGGIYRSLDGGDTWLPTSGLPSQAQARLLTVSHSTPTTMYAEVRNAVQRPLGLYKSSDGGATWSAAGLDGQGIAALAVHPLSDQIVYAAADWGLSRSTDGGNTWSVLSWFPDGGDWATAFAIDPVHPQILYAATFEQISRSVDGGATWEILRGNLPLSSWWYALTMGINPAAPETLLVGTSVRGAWEMTVAPDLKIEAASSPPLTQNSPATFTYTLSNESQFSATGVGATIRLPRGAQNATASSTSGGACSVAGRTVICTYAVLRNAGPAQISVTFTPTRAGTAQVQATVQGDQPDEESTNNSSQLQVTVEGC